METRERGMEGGGIHRNLVGAVSPESKIQADKQNLLNLNNCLIQVYYYIQYTNVEMRIHRGSVISKWYTVDSEPTPSQQL